MFVPVACLRCGKLFQVPPAAAGTDVTCPWCREPTPALPVAGGPPSPPAPPPEPLSLDDAEPVPAPAPPPAPTAAPRWSAPRVVALVGGMAVLAAATVLALGYRSGRVYAGTWGEFTAPDGSFTALFPGTPTATPVEPNTQAALTRGGEEYAAAGWYSGVKAWVGWQNLDPGATKLLADDKDGVIAAALIDAERDRRVRAATGAVAKKGVIQTNFGRGQVVQTDLPRGKRVEYYVVAGGPRPRLYVVGVESPKLDPDGPLPGKVWAAFRPAGP